MAELHDRVGYLEGKVEEQSQALAGLRASMDEVVRRIGGVEGRLAVVEARLASVEARLDRLEDKVDRHFVWLVGIQLTTLVAIVGALLTR